MRFNGERGVSREIYNNGFQVSDETIELSQEAASELSQTVSNAYKTLSSDITKEYMSQLIRIPMTGGSDRYVEVYSLMPSSNQISLVNSETKLTYYLSSFYPEKNDERGTAIQDAVESLMTLDPKYIENEF